MTQSKIKVLKALPLPRSYKRRLALRLRAQMIRKTSRKAHQVAAQIRNRAKVVAKILPPKTKHPASPTY